MSIIKRLEEINIDKISETIRDRQKIKNELKTLTAQGRLSTVIFRYYGIFTVVI